jgi:DNA/RNA endonuclease YhcR with UshA esterase domain
MKLQIRAIALLASLVLALMAPLSAMADQTITGEVSDAQEIIASDGSVYTILDNEKGEELAAMVGDTVAVTGTVEEVDGTKSITVESFIVIDK